MTRKLVTVITGSNRGIGLGIARTLATHQWSQPLLIYATSRKGESLDITAQHDNEIHYAKLDTSDKTSILNFLRNTVKQDPHARAVDILINNAGVNLNHAPSTENVNTTIDVNYRGTRDMCALFLEQGNMKSNQGARIVNVSSVASESISKCSAELAAKFRSESLTIPEIDELADQYVKAVETKMTEEVGWGQVDSYSASKILVNAMTRVLARDNKDLLINACCPGWVDSDMGNQIGKPPKSLEDGARIPVRLAVEDVEGLSGEYWSNPGVMDTGNGRVKEW